MWGDSGNESLQVARAFDCIRSVLGIGECGKSFTDEQVEEPPRFDRILQKSGPPLGGDGSQFSRHFYRIADFRRVLDRETSLQGLTFSFLRSQCQNKCL